MFFAMRLSLRASLLRHGSGCSFATRLKALAEKPIFDGAELSLTQLQVAPELTPQLRVVCRLSVTDADDTGRQLDLLANHLARQHARVDLVIVEAPHEGLTDVVQHLVDVSPAVVSFLESHPSVVSETRRLNAHGNPLQDHVSGLCHAFSGSVASLADILDVLPPTRLSLSAHNMWTLPECDADARDESIEQATAPLAVDSDVGGWIDELDAVLLGTDHLYASATDPAAVSSYWEEVWSALQLEGGQEAIVTCASGHDATADEVVDTLAAQLRSRFDRTASWREGAAERRAAAPEAAAAASRLVSSGPGAAGPLGEAARAFGLDSGDLLDARRVKERFRALALKHHPDVVGGDDGAFLALKQHYRTLLRACTPSATPA